MHPSCIPKRPAAAAAKLLQSCPTLRPHRWQPTRLPRPWDSPGKNTGMGCHFLLQCMKVKSKSEVAQSYPTLSDLMDCSLPGSSIHGIFQARALEWVAIISKIRELSQVISKFLSTNMMILFYVCKDLFALITQCKYQQKHGEIMRIVINSRHFKANWYQLPHIF